MFALDPRDPGEDGVEEAAVTDTECVRWGKRESGPIREKKV